MTKEQKKSRIKRRPWRKVPDTLSPEWEEVFWSLMKKDSFHSCHWFFACEYPGIDKGIEHDGPERMRQIIERREIRT
jgi:hypothetical protein|tara:strand:- start:773 stop:1003 length:231 start_codon:yes stop_codon:yes gene_type:complete